MICYLDASALVKRYVVEPGSKEVSRVIAEAETVGTAVISLVEVSAALAKAARLGLLARNDALSSYEIFKNEWPNFVRLQITEFAMERAARLAWEYDLRGYDAVHLAEALIWQEAMDAPVTMAVFDRRLWGAAKRVSLIPFPSDLPTLLASWKVR